MESASCTAASSACRFDQPQSEEHCAGAYGCRMVCEGSFMRQVAVTDGAIAFDTEHSQTWVSELARELRWEEHRAYGLLKSVLHGVRDRLSADETAKLSALLPATVQNMFLEEWEPSE